MSSFAVPSPPVRRQPFGSRKTTDNQANAELLVPASEAAISSERIEQKPELQPTDAEELKERAAALIEAHQRGQRDRLDLKQKKAAAVTIEKISRGHSLRAQAAQKLPAKRIPVEPIRVVICGCQWSGASEQADKLSWKLPSPCIRFEDISGEINDNAGLTVTTRTKLQSSTSWVLDGSNLATAAECEDLLALPQPPTHWILCKIEDDVAEARALAADARCDPGWVREQLRIWKLRMINVYKACPTGGFLHVTTGQKSADDAQWEILTAVLSAEGNRSIPDAQKPSSSVGLSARPVGSEEGIELSDHNEKLPQFGASKSSRHLEYSDIEIRTPHEMLPFTAVNHVETFKRVDSIIEDWRSRSVLSRLAKFPSSFVRQHVALDGRLLMSIQGAALSAEFTSDWKEPVWLCCSAAVVNIDGEQLPEVEEQSTRQALCQSYVWWNDELCLNLPRSVLFQPDVFVQLTLTDMNQSTALAQARRSLVELMIHSNQSQMWSRLDRDWEFSEPSLVAQQNAAGEPMPVARARVRSQVIDFVGVFDELMIQPRAEAALSTIFAEELLLAEEQLGMATRTTTGSAKEIEMAIMQKDFESKQEEAVKALVEAELERAAADAERRKCNVGTQTDSLEQHTREEAGRNELDEALRIAHEEHYKATTVLELDAAARQSTLLHELAMMEDHLRDVSLNAKEMAAKLEEVFGVPNSSSDTDGHPKQKRERPAPLPPVNVMPHLEKQRRAQLATKPGVKASAKPKVQKPAAKPAARPAAKPTAKPAAKPSAKPSAKPKAKPVAKPRAKPLTKEMNKTKATQSPSSKSKVKPAAKPRSKPMAKGKPTEGKPTAKSEAKTQLKDALASSLKKVKDLFKVWDVDGSGTIDREEFRKAVNELNLVPGLTTEACDAAFDDYDLDGGGEIEYPEYIRYTLRDAIARSMGKVMDLFKEIDVDHSGQIDKKEFRKAIRTLGFEAPTEDLDHLFDEVDVDGSGEIEFKELNKVLRVGAMRR